MKKRVVDLTALDLNQIASDAWRSAAQTALAQGQAVTGSRDGRRLRYHPDGRVEDLGPVTPLGEDQAPDTPEARSGRDRRSVA